MAIDTGIDCALSLGGVAVPAILQGCSVDFNRALQPILIANGGNPLIGYSPGNGAKSGFNTQFFLPYTSAASALNAALNSVGVPIALSFGAAGGIALANAICMDMTISGSENNKIECRAMFESASKPVFAPQSFSPGDFSAGVWLFNDVTSLTMISGTYTDVSQFSFRIVRTPIRFVGNSPTGIPKHLGVGHREVTFDVEWLKSDDAEASASITDCPSQGDVTILMTQACAGSNTLALVSNASVYGTAPTSTGGLEAYVLQRITGMATLGGFAITGS